MTIRQKCGYAFLTVLELAVYVGCFVINHYTHSRMGMSRYVVVKSKEWNAAFRLDTVLPLAAAVLGIALLILLFLQLKSRFPVLCSAENILVLAIMLGIVFGLNMEKLREYYFVAVLVELAALLQVMKLFCFLPLKKKKRG